MSLSKLEKFHGEKLQFSFKAFLISTGTLIVTSGAKLI